MSFSEATKGTRFCFDTREGECEGGWNNDDKTTVYMRLYNNVLLSLFLINEDKSWWASVDKSLFESCFESHCYIIIKNEGWELMIVDTQQSEWG